MSTENALPPAADPSVEYMGALIRRLRESAGMTLTDLSRVAGVSQGLLSPTMNGQLLVLKVRVPAGYSNESVPFSHHRAEKCLFVLAGTCYFQIGEDGHTLEVGDSITYKGDQPHWFRVLGDAEAVIIATMTPPVF